MMKSKVMIKAVFPSIDKEYDINIPVNELAWKVNKLIVKAIYDMNGIPVDLVNDKFITNVSAPPAFRLFNTCKTRIIFF